MKTNMTQLVAALMLLFIAATSLPAMAKANFVRSAAIGSPAAGAELQPGTIEFTASLTDLAGNDSVQWAVRAGTCVASSGTLAGNVDGFNTAFSWNGASFSATVDMGARAPGSYCFIFNPTESAGDAAIRETRTFMLVLPPPPPPPEPDPGTTSTTTDQGTTSTSTDSATTTDPTPMADVQDGGTPQGTVIDTSPRAPGSSSGGGRLATPVVILPSPLVAGVSDTRMEIPGASGAGGSAANFSAPVCGGQSLWYQVNCLALGVTRVVLFSLGLE